MGRQNDRWDDSGVTIDRPLARQGLKLEPPPGFAVIMLDDDFTPMDFVVEILIELFDKTDDEAEAIMIDVHVKGKGWAGSYTRDIAETRVAQVTSLAQANEHPFICEIEPIH